MSGAGALRVAPAALSADTAACGVAPQCWAWSGTLGRPSLVRGGGWRVREQRRVGAPDPRPDCLLQGGDPLDSAILRARMDHRMPLVRRLAPARVAPAQLYRAQFPDRCAS